MSHKRVVSENSKDLSDPTRHKTARPSSQMSPAVSEATVEQLNAEVARLNAYIDEVHGFIDSLHATARTVSNPSHEECNVSDSGI